MRRVCLSLAPPMFGSVDEAKGLAFVGGRQRIAFGRSYLLPGAPPAGTTLFVLTRDRGGGAGG